MADQEDLINQFVDITGVTTDRAKFYLEAANFTLEVCMSGFCRLNFGFLQFSVYHCASEENIVLHSSKKICVSISGCFVQFL